MEKPTNWTAGNPEDHQPRPRSRRIWLFRLVACGVPVTLGLLAVVVILVRQQRLVVDAEGKLKLQSPPIYLEEPGHERTGHRYLYDQTLGWRNIPNWKATTNGRPLTINSQGLRDKEYSVDKPIGISRILVLGDSYAWGYGVADDEVFSEVLERKIQSDVPWQVINSGVSGWGTDQQYLYLKHEGLKYSPDIVVLAFFLVNDPQNNVNCMQYGLHKPVFMNLDLRLANSPVPSPGSSHPGPQPRVDPIDLTLAIIRGMARVTEQHGADLVVMKFGNFLFADNLRLTQAAERMEAELSQRADLFYLDFDRQVRQRGITSSELLEGNDDGHWNARGHAIAAELLLEFLNQRSLL